MASTTNFSCEKCGENFSIILGPLAHTERSQNDDLDSVDTFIKALTAHKADKQCDGKVVYGEEGFID